MHLTTLSSRWNAAALATVLCLGLSAAAPAQEPLTLRINDAEARPGQILALVLRTYASRQLGQGHIGVRSNQNLRSGEGAGGSDLLAQPLGAVVFSDEDDAVSRFRVDNSGPETSMELRFSSPTATVNQSDGPLAVLYFRLPTTAVPGARIDVTVDPLESFLFDETGQPVPIAVTSGRVRVKDIGDRYGVGAGAEVTVPGEPAILSLETSEVQRLSAGQAAFRFKRGFFDGAPVVTIDPRYGTATWTVDHSTPGLVIVTFESPDHSLNFVPGSIVTVSLPSRAETPSGTSTAIFLDRDLTYLIDDQGANLPLDIERGLLVFE